MTHPEKPRVSEQNNGVAARESQVWVGRVTILIASAVAAIAADIAVRPADEAKEAD